MVHSDREVINDFPKQEIVTSTKPYRSLKKPTNITIIETPNNQDLGPGPSTPLSSRGEGKRKSIIAEGQGNNNHMNMNGVTETAAKIELLLESFSIMDHENFLPLISKLLSVLTNWELQSNKEISTACKSILLLSESRMCGALTEPNNITQMVNLLDSQNVPLKIQVTMVNFK